MSADLIHHPPHYAKHPSGLECIDVTRSQMFCIGNAIKYLWRSGKKNQGVEDLRKSLVYLEWAEADGSAVIRTPKVEKFLQWWESSVNEIPTPSRPEDMAICLLIEFGPDYAAGRIQELWRL